MSMEQDEEVPLPLPAPAADDDDDDDEELNVPAQVAMPTGRTSPLPRQQRVASRGDYYGSSEQDVPDMHSPPLEEQKRSRDRSRRRKKRELPSPKYSDGDGPAATKSGRRDRRRDKKNRKHRKRRSPMTSESSSGSRSRSRSRSRSNSRSRDRRSRRSRRGRERRDRALRQLRDERAGRSRRREPDTDEDGGDVEFLASESDGDADHRGGGRGRAAAAAVAAAESSNGGAAADDEPAQRRIRLADADDAEAAVVPGALGDDFMAVSLFSTPTCDTILNTPTPQLSVFKTAIREMTGKWVHRFRTTDARARPIPYILSNFGIEYDSATHTLLYRTNSAAVQALERRNAGPRKAGRRRGGGTDASAGPVQNVTVKNGEALELAMLEEVSLAYYLQAFVNDDHVYDGWSDYARPKRYTMIEIIDIINNCHRQAEHWFCHLKQVDDHVGDNGDGDDGADDDKMVNFPSFESGIQTRLRTLIEHMTPYRKVMIYLLGQCRKNNYRRHGTQLYQQKFIPTYTLKRHADGELICEECGKRKSEHEQRDVSRRPDCVFRPECIVDEDNLISTYAWEPLPQHSEIGEFVRMQCRRHREPSMWFASLESRDKLAHELGQTVGSKDLPIKPSFNNEWGLVISFRNGLYFVFMNQFVPYAAVGKDDFPNLATRYIDAWFHNDILYQRLLGDPDPVVDVDVVRFGAELMVQDTIKEGRGNRPEALADVDSVAVEEGLAVLVSALAPKLVLATVFTDLFKVWV